MLVKITIIHCIYALWIENANESDPCSYEATKAVEASMGFELMTNGIQTCDRYQCNALPTEL